MLSLENKLSSKLVKLLLTELGVITVDFPEDWIVGQNVPLGMTGLENHTIVETPDMLNIPEIGLTIKIIDKPDIEGSGRNFEIARDALQKNIREIFDRLGIKVYVFKDRIEIRGYIPIEVLDIPLESKESRGGAIIHSAGLTRGRIVLINISPSPAERLARRGGQRG
jgi:hypothetical protein